MLTPPSPDRIRGLSSELALTCDAGGCIRWVDEQAARLLGARPGLPFVSLVAPGVEDKAQAFLQQACAGETDAWELVLVAGGRPVLFTLRGAPEPSGALLVGSVVPEQYHSAQQQVADAMGELARRERDTERQRRQLAEAHVQIQHLLAAERAAREQAESERARLQQVLDQLPEAILIVDADGRFAIGNATAATVLGIDVAGESMPSGSESAFATRHLDGAPIPAEALPLQRSANTGEVVLGEQLVLRAADGRDVPLLVNSAPLYDASGRRAGAISVFQDITSIKGLERQKDEFLATVSHDLKNPLAGIKGWVQLLHRRAGARLPEAERQRWQQDLTAVDAIATRMAGMLDELLDATHLQMGRPLELRRQPTDLVALARRVAEDNQQLAEAHVISVQSQLPSLEGEWDRARLERVVGNLVSNAVKYSPDGGDVTLEVSRQDTADGVWAVLAVTDQGVGIPPEELPRVFERFYRASNVAGQIAGTGIGLAGAKQLVEQHGGSISVQSTPGQGSTFLVRLPIEPARE